MRLTDLSVKALHAPEKNSVIYSDDALIGFGVRVTSTGVKSYVLTHGVRRQRETIGRVGVITLQEARNEARRILAEYTLGKDKVASVPWCLAVDEYLGEIAATRKPRTHYDYSRILDMYFRFGKTKMDDIGPSDLLPRIGKLKHIPAEQQHVFVVLRAFIRWAYRQHYIEHNPMDRMRQPKGYRARDRVLSDEELVRVWHASGDTTYGKIIKMLILTGQREGEIAHMCQDMIGPDTIRFPDWLTKNSRKHEIPYGPMTAALLPSNDGLLFPARRRDWPFNGWGACKVRLDKVSGVSGWRLHDLRRTFRTKWEELGIYPTVSERYINHVSGAHAGIVRIYNRHKYVAEMRAAVEIWEAHLTALLADRESNPAVTVRRAA